MKITHYTVSTKDELLESLNSRFNHVYKEDKYIIATLLDPRFKGSFYDTTTSRLAVERLIAACQREPTSVFKEHQVAQSCESQLQTGECDLLEQPSITGTSNPSTKKKGFNIYNSYKKAIKKLPVQLQVPLLQSTLRKVCQLW